MRVQHTLEDSCERVGAAVTGGFLFRPLCRMGGWFQTLHLLGARRVAGPLVPWRCGTCPVGCEARIGVASQAEGQRTSPSGLRRTGG